MNINRLKYFIAVVEEGSITAAAIKLNITQPTLSIMIKKLEDELDITLFKRKNKRLQLTNAGDLLFKRSKYVVSSIDDMLTEVKDVSSGLRGEIKVGCSTAANLIVIPTIVENIQKNTPDVIVRVVEGDARYLHDLLLMGQLDVAIVRTIFPEDVFETYSIIKEPIVACMHNEHPLLKKEQLTLKDFEHENFLLNTTTIGLGLSDYIIEKCLEIGYSPNIKYWGSQGLPMAILASRGVGVTFLPSSFQHLPFRDGLPAFRKLHDPDLSSNLELITLRDRYRSKATESFLEQVIDLSNKYNSKDYFDN